MTLDEQLSASAPPVPARTADLDRELLFVIAEAERLAWPARRHRRRLTIGGLAALGAVAVGTAAAGAAGQLPWYDSAPSRGSATTATGEKCDVVYGVKGIEVQAHPVGAATRAAAIAAAEEFLESFDASSVRIDQDSLAEVQKLVDAELVKQGLPTTAVGVSMALTCDGVAK
ncbi:hypothetical protein [Nocardioides sp.]|uniref:hypothetical protein n=1 Tax=Nocardioides sp. TaxID=35761 RepID=UPI0026256831|nr:hypothetical protein [Nocardioides sp.]MDI6908406.1 hypothetical protein [Nocardioides sp.]